MFIGYIKRVDLRVIQNKTVQDLGHNSLQTIPHQHDLGCYATQPNFWRQTPNDTDSAARML